MSVPCQRLQGKDTQREGRGKAAVSTKGWGPRREGPLSQPALLLEGWRPEGGCQGRAAGVGARLARRLGSDIYTLPACEMGKLVNLSVTVVTFSVKWGHSNTCLVGCVHSCRVSISWE